MADVSGQEEIAAQHRMMSIRSAIDSANSVIPLALRTASEILEGRNSGVESGRDILGVISKAADSLHGGRKPDPFGIVEGDDEDYAGEGAQQAPVPPPFGAMDQYYWNPTSHPGQPGGESRRGGKKHRPKKNQGGAWDGFGGAWPMMQNYFGGGWGMSAPAGFPAMSGREGSGVADQSSAAAPYPYFPHYSSGYYNWGYPTPAMGGWDGLPGGAQFMNGVAEAVGGEVVGGEGKEAAAISHGRQPADSEHPSDPINQTPGNHREPHGWPQYIRVIHSWAEGHEPRIPFTRHMREPEEKGEASAAYHSCRDAISSTPADEMVKGDCIHRNKLLLPAEFPDDIIRFLPPAVPFSDNFQKDNEKVAQKFSKYRVKRSTPPQLNSPEELLERLHFDPRILCLDCPENPLFSKNPAEDSLTEKLCEGASEQRGNSMETTLNNLFLSWYYAGYYTGRRTAFAEAEEI